MKSTLIFTLFFSALITSMPSGLSIRQDNGEFDDLTIKPMTFIGPVEVGRPNVTFTGDAQSIYDQILRVNPNYDPSAFPGHEETQSITEAALAKRTLSKRDNIVCMQHGNMIFQSDLACLPQLIMLDNIKGYCMVDARACVRTACGDSCGIWLCNNNYVPIGVDCPLLRATQRKLCINARSGIMMGW
ncbi:hypothetical protein QBC34DRAFT_459116 [Podospora aff. communis PSN243]|uniref:Secreted protein n=1 Tax=Podospora aff. communis PSN243 TaxID=3040156 RepID=A0AAV9GS92_9PEZI|nr:hypothetical protein QBC34DRAFT_459116 [Podospora aff. communis PSN243]